MIKTKRRPITVGQILLIEFIEPMSLNSKDLSDAIGVSEGMIINIINDKGELTPELATKLAATLGNTPDFWINIQRAVKVWDENIK